MATIEDIHPREIYDSRGTPTVEVDLFLSDGSMGRAAVPSGASTGKHEALELRDEDTRHGGKGVLKACDNIRTILLPALKGIEADQQAIDQKMIELDGTENKGRLGANAILGISLALAKAAALANKEPLWQYFRGLSTTVPSEIFMPVPMMNILNGGKHADKSTDIQEFMIMPVGAERFHDAIHMGAEIFSCLRKILKAEGYATTVGDEGGFAPSLTANKDALKLISRAVQDVGYTLGKEVVIGLDVASSELYREGNYHLACEGKTFSADQMIDLYADWVSEYPIASIEDPLEEDDWSGYRKLTDQLGKTIQIVGDDLFVTNVDRLTKGINAGAANSILIKLNQIGTVTETIATIDLARSHNYTAIISHRSGETEDTTIADFVVGLSTGQIKTGSLSRTDRVAKYNQLLRIEESLGDKAIYPGKEALKFS